MSVAAEAFGRHPAETGEAVATGRSVDWAQAESLALASILSEGTPIRLTGQDTRFYVQPAPRRALRPSDRPTAHPLHHLLTARASFEVVDSPVTEAAVLGFEYGYSVQAPDALVLWEVQYGDFVNGAQVIVDQFITSARAKWGQEPSLVMLLPHGYEGCGPSTQRPPGALPRGAAEDNIRAAYCTTAAQYFHLLGRQGHCSAAPRAGGAFTQELAASPGMASSPTDDLDEARRSRAC